MVATSTAPTAEPIAHPGHRPVGRSRMADREGVLAPLFLLPAVAYIVLLVAVPFALAIVFSVTDVTTASPAHHFVGLGNFRAAWRDPVFRKALHNTLVFTAITMVIVLVLAKALALLLVVDFRFKRLVRFFVLLPWTTPAALAAISWLWLLDNLFSPIDWVLRQVHVLGPNAHMNWLGKPHLAAISIIAVQVWRLTPLAAVIILAGLTAIPREINDAAAVDGAGFWRQLWAVTIPLTLPVMAVAVLFGAILTFTDMAVVYVLTPGGGSANATQVLTTWAFYKGINSGDLGQGAAVALFLFPLLLAAAIAILVAVRRMEVL
jgi:multiple sugar transport system permease protein